MLDTIGWIGAWLMAICGLPQAWQSYQQGHSDGLSKYLLWLWSLGEIFTLIYVLPKFDWPLIFNYGTNLFSLSIIVWYKLKPRKHDYRRRHWNW